MPAPYHYGYRRVLPGALVATTAVAPVVVADPVVARDPAPVALAAPRPAPALCAPVSGAASQAAGSFATVTFLPTTTIGDISALLTSYGAAVVEGPSANGTYRIRLSSEALPAAEAQRIIDSLRAQTAFVSAVEAA
jgi:hypothetical protein